MEKEVTTLLSNGIYGVTFKGTFSKTWSWDYRIHCNYCPDELKCYLMLLWHLIVFIKREGARNSAFNAPLTFAKWGKQLVQEHLLLSQIRSVADPGFSPGGGANSQKCYYFSIFCRKLHENERIWTPEGRGARPWRPPWIRQCRFILSTIVTTFLFFRWHFYFLC